MAPVVAVVAAVPQVTLPGYYTPEPVMVTTMQGLTVAKAVGMVITQQLPMVLMLS